MGKLNFEGECMSFVDLTTLSARSCNYHVTWMEIWSIYISTVVCPRLKCILTTRHLMMLKLYFAVSCSCKTGTDSLVVLGSFPQSSPGLLWELSWLCSTPADALPFGVVDVPKIIQRSSLPNLQQAQQIFTEGNQSDQCCNYILKIHWHQIWWLACGPNYSRGWLALGRGAYQTRAAVDVYVMAWLKTKRNPFVLIKCPF